MPPRRGRRNSAAKPTPLDQIIEGEAESSYRKQLACSVQALVTESLSSRYLILTRVIHNKEQPGVHATLPYLSSSLRWAPGASLPIRARVSRYSKLSKWNLDSFYCYLLGVLDRV